MLATITFGKIMAYIGIGIIVGPIARFLVPGRDPMGWVMTILLGIGGAVIGGYLATVVTPDNKGVPWIASILGGIILVLVVRLFRGRQGARG